MAEHVDHVELIFGIDAELNSDSNGEDLQKIAAGLGVLWFITSLSQEHLLKTAPVRESKILKSWSLNLSPRRTTELCKSYRRRLSLPMLVT